MWRDAETQICSSLAPPCGDKCYTAALKVQAKYLHIVLKAFLFFGTMLSSKQHE